MGTLTHSSDRQAFTLIELMAVLVIMVIIMGVAVGGFLSWGKSAGMRGSVLNVKSSMDLARQRAITFRERTTFTYGNTTNFPIRGWYTVKRPAKGNPSVLKLIGVTNYVADGVIFANSSEMPYSFTYRMDGTCGGMMQESFLLQGRETGTNVMYTIVTVYPLTGRSKTTTMDEM